MNGAEAIPFPADDPQAIRDLAASVDGQREAVNNAHRIIGEHANALVPSWQGDAGTAAVRELDHMRRPLWNVAHVLFDTTPKLHVYAERLDRARAEIGQLQTQWDLASSSHDQAVTRAAQQATDEAGEWHLRQTAVEQLESAHRQLRNRQADIFDEVYTTAVQIGGEIEELVETWIGPIDRVGGATGALIEGRYFPDLPLLSDERALVESSGELAVRVGLDLSDAIDEFLGGDLLHDPKNLDDLLALLDIIHQHADDPAFAAILLSILGAARFQALPGVLTRWIGTDTDERQQRVVDAMDDLGELFATASHTSGHAGGLSSDFVFDLTGIDLNGPQVAPVADADLQARIDEIQNALTAAGIAATVAQPIAHAAGAGRIAVIFRGAGRAIAFVSVGSAFIDVVQASSDPAHTTQAAASVASAGFAVAAVLLPTGPPSWVAAGLSTIFAIVSLLGPHDGPPPAQTYPPGPTPGGSHFDSYVDGAGVPIPSG